MGEKKHTPSGDNAGQKKFHLEAVRGIAALVVVVGHYLNVFYPHTIFGSAGNYTQHGAWENLLLSTPLGFFRAGDFAVCIFFILSGYVLSYKYLGEENVRYRIIGAIIKRPFRLGGLVVFSQIISAIIWAGGLYFNEHVSEITTCIPWFSNVWSSGFDIKKFIADILCRPFKNGTLYNVPLWTIFIELYGSFLVFFYLLVFGKKKYRWLVSLGLLIYFHDSLYQGFIWGILLADTKKNYHLFFRFMSYKYVPITLLLVGASLANFPNHIDPGALEKTFYKWLPDLNIIGGGYSMLGAIFVFVGLNSHSGIKSFLNARAFVILGRLSYSSYVIHFIVLGSISSWLFIRLWEMGIGYDKAFITAFTLSLFIIMVLSYFLEKTVDRSAIRVSGFIGKRVTDYLQKSTWRCLR